MVPLGSGGRGAPGVVMAVRAEVSGAASLAVALSAGATSLSHGGRGVAGRAYTRGRRAGALGST